MSRISHRELRNSSAEVLRRVAGGESFEITNHGELAALLIPPPDTPLDRVRAAGRSRASSADATLDLRTIARGSSSSSSAEIVEDVRGRW